MFVMSCCIISTYVVEFLSSLDETVGIVEARRSARPTAEVIIESIGKG